MIGSQIDPAAGEQRLGLIPRLEHAPAVDAENG